MLSAETMSNVKMNDLIKNGPDAPNNRLNPYSGAMKTSRGTFNNVVVLHRSFQAPKISSI